MKNCPKCKEDKELNEFGNNKNTKDKKQRYCKTCQAEFDNKHYLSNKKQYIVRRKLFQQNVKKWYLDYKKEQKCSKCSEDRYWVLDFHHLEPEKKEMNMDRARRCSIEKLKKEIEKCIVLCSNCHRDLHFQERNIIE